MPIEIKPFVRDVSPDDIAAKAKEVKLIPEAQHEDIDLTRRVLRKMCVMQFIAYLTGQVKTIDDGKIITNITDAPVCVSKEIRFHAIEINDSTGVKNLQKFVDPEFIRKLMGTAPIAERVIRRRKKDGTETVRVTQVTVDGDPRYKAAEKQRRAMIAEMEQEYTKAHPHAELGFWLSPRVPIEDKMAFLIRLADVARFDTPETMACAIINGKIQGKDPHGDDPDGGFDDGPGGQQTHYDQQNERQS